MGGALAELTLLQVSVSEIAYTWVVIPEIWSGGGKRGIQKEASRSGHNVGHEK